MNFWNQHDLFFVLFIFFFPRLTLLFSTVPFGGIFWWLGWIFAPRVLAAVLATISYMETNPMLVLLSWIWATSFELMEKRGAQWTLRKPKTPFVFRFIRSRHTKNDATNNKTNRTQNAGKSSGKYGDDVIDV